MHLPRLRHLTAAIAISAVGAIAAIGATATPALAKHPDLVLRHGKIFTGDASKPWASAIAIADDKIIAVGNESVVNDCAAHGARVIDLGGRTVIPGINDAHVHVVVPLGAYLNAPTFVPGPGPSLADVQGMLSAGAAATPAGTWLFAFVGNAVSDDPNVERYALDAVSAGHPVVLFAWSGHGMWLDSEALAALGYSDSEADPFGGFWRRYPGTPTITGEAHEYAEFGVRRRLLAQLPDAALVGEYQAFAQGALRFGVTSLQDMAVGLPHARAVSVIEQAHLPVRMRSMCFPLSPNEACAIDNSSGNGNDDMVSATGIKWITDGTPIERLAFLDGEYADRPGERGYFDLGAALPQVLNRSLTHDATGYQILFHAVGDGAIDNILEAMEATPGGPHRWQKRRSRIEHGDLLFADQFQRVRDLGIVIVQNPLHFTLTTIFDARFDADTRAALEPMRSLLANNIPLAIGSDAIGQPANPYLDMFFATIEPTHPAEALTIAQAVAAYTRGSAYAENAESKKGVLAPGKLADLAVLSQDIFSVPPPALPATTSLLTIVGGDVAWDAGVL